MIPDQLEHFAELMKKGPEDLLRMALLDQANKIEQILNFIPRCTVPQQQQQALAELIIMTANNQLSLCRILLKEYH